MKGAMTSASMLDEANKGGPFPLLTFPGIRFQSPSAAQRGPASTDCPFSRSPNTMMFFLVFEPSVTQPGSTMANSSFFSSHSAVLTEMSYDPCHHSKLRKPSGTLSGPVPVFYMILMVFSSFFLFIFLTVCYWGASILD